MQVGRKVGHAPLVTSMAKQIAELRSACVGCKDCRGICHALIETLSLPEAVLDEKTK